MLVLDHDYEVLKTEWLVPSKTLLCSIKHTMMNEERKYMNAINLCVCVGSK